MKSSIIPKLNIHFSLYEIDVLPNPLFQQTWRHYRFWNKFDWN